MLGLLGVVSGLIFVIATLSVGLPVLFLPLLTTGCACSDLFSGACGIPRDLEDTSDAC